MLFVLIANDEQDAGAAQRRIDARADHLAHIADAKAKGQVLLGGPLSDDAGKTTGSMLVVNFADRASVQSWMETDPYVAAKVWGDVSIRAFAVAPSFQNIFSLAA